jgi:hypothetical protein
VSSSSGSYCWCESACTPADPGYTAAAGGGGEEASPYAARSPALPRDFASTLRLFSTSRMIRFSIIAAWKLPHSCSRRRRYHSTLSRCALMALARASSSCCSIDLAGPPLPSPPAAHAPMAPRPSRAYRLRVSVVSVFCRSCSASARLRMLALSSRRSCLVSASTSSFCRSLRCFDCDALAVE